MLQLGRCALLHKRLHRGGGEAVVVGSQLAGLGQRGRIGKECQASTSGPCMRSHGPPDNTSDARQYGACKGPRPNTALHAGMAARNPPASGWWPHGGHHPALAALCAAPPAAERRADRCCCHDASARHTARLPKQAARQPAAHAIKPTTRPQTAPAKEEGRDQTHHQPARPPAGGSAPQRRRPGCWPAWQ